MITDILARETKEVKNKPLLFYYVDGSVEKKFISEYIEFGKAFLI